MTETAKSIFIDMITHNSNLSTRKIFYLLSESELEIIIAKVQLQEL